MNLTEWNITRCRSCGDWAIFDRACFTCSTLNLRPNERSSEMNALTNGGIAIGSKANGETSLR
jgi:ribosomal protein L32